MKSTFFILLFFFVIIPFSNPTKVLAQADFETVQNASSILFTVEGFSGPEAVRYFEEDQVYFVANFNGAGNAKDANGFISKVNSSGEIESLKFMIGTSEHPLHAPRGMFIQNNSLFVADIDGVHQFNVKTGAHQHFINLSEFNPGFLNDISGSGNGELFVTDTGNRSIYIIEDGVASIFSDSVPVFANGITYDITNEVFVLAPWRGDTVFYSFNFSGEFTPAYTFNGGNFDGIEFDENHLIAATQSDSTIRAHDSNTENAFIKTTGRPADIGINRKDKIIAVPYIALNKVDFWKYSKK